MTTATRTLACPSCNKNHQVDSQTYADFGPDTQCLKCVDWAHVDFMAANAEAMKMACVKECRCGYGPGGRNA